MGGWVLQGRRERGGWEGGRGGAGGRGVCHLCQLLAHTLAAPQLPPAYAPPSTLHPPGARELAKMKEFIEEQATELLDETTA